MGGATPNVALGRAMAEAEMTNNGLARRVRDLAARRGVRSAADHVAVKRWLDGTQPKAETAVLIATCLSEKLGRTVTPYGLGFTAVVTGDEAPAAPVEPVVYPDDADTATDRLDSVAAADTAGILVPGPHAWDGFATPSIITGYLFDDRSEYRRPDTDDAPVDAEAIRLTTARLMELDFQLGGGHTRELLLFYFRSQVLPLLRALPRGAGRADILSATAELAQMLGWSAYDAGRHAAAQRYLTYGLRLARDAGDVLLGARLLANLSHQANYLGRYRDAVQLSRAAITTSTGIPAPATLAMLHAMEARALASLADGPGAERALGRAEASLHQGGDADPAWIGYFDPAELAGEAAHCFRDLGRGEETRRFARLAAAPDATPPRTRAFIGMVLAAGALHDGALDESIAAARSAIEIVGPLRSSRYRKYVADFTQKVSTLHPRDHRIIELKITASTVLPTLDSCQSSHQEP